jgi:hypothetical protein
VSGMADQHTKHPFVALLYLSAMVSVEGRQVERWTRRSATERRV